MSHFQNLGLNDPPRLHRIARSFRNVYQAVAGSDDYKHNQYHLKIIQVCVITVSAVATGYVNAFAHQKTLGVSGALLLAIGITGFVEYFYFILRHGLTTIYSGGRQRFYAVICYYTIQMTMVLNVAILCARVVNFQIPPTLMIWNHWSIACHFALALIGVALVRDSDPVVENRILELKSAKSRQDIVTNRRAAAIGNPIVIGAARVRGFFDALSLAGSLLLKSEQFAKRQMEQLKDVTDAEFRHIDEYQIVDGQVVNDVASLPVAHKPRVGFNALTDNAELNRMNITESDDPKEPSR